MQGAEYPSVHDGRTTKNVGLRRAKRRRRLPPPGKKRDERADKKNTFLRSQQAPEPGGKQRSHSRRLFWQIASAKVRMEGGSRNIILRQQTVFDRANNRIFLWPERGSNTEIHPMVEFRRCRAGKIAGIRLRRKV